FTGQRSDTASGLDYYGARYYDPLAGQFTSGDSLLPGGGLDLWGLSRYAYVGGDPIARTDPTGHIHQCEDCCGPDPNPPVGGGRGGGPTGAGGGTTGGGGCDVLPECAPSGGGGGRGNGGGATGGDATTSGNPFGTFTPAPRQSGPTIKVISATCLQVNGYN